MTTGRINQVASSRRGASTTRRSRKAPQHRAGASAVEQKLGDQTSFANPTKSIGTAAFTWVHEHFRRPAFRAHPRETKPEGKRTIHQGELPLSAKNTQSTRGMPATQRGRGRSVVMKGRRRADETTAHTGGSTTRACPTCTTRRSAQRSAYPDAPPVHGEATKAPYRRRQASQDRRGGTERSRRERERSKTRSWAKGSLAGHLGLSLAAREELKAIAQRSPRGKWPLHCSAAEGQAIA
ncbi:hypothetical protein H6P81_015973 [Aristolochia fimbriata]|uniref:Uncharacterized protein n=1 Tax=Aristolochia fimbriata TaxID=158543 RepID=A0AAV7EBM3_ARIFI|nr:hypothetical protein H6P81_015973 [Aristolochia fimbriata]